MATCGSDRVVRRFHDRQRRGRNDACGPVEGRELAELAARVERLKQVDEAFAHVKLSAFLARRDGAKGIGCSGGGDVATEVRPSPLFCS